MATTLAFLLDIPFWDALANKLCLLPGPLLALPQGALQSLHLTGLLVLERVL